MSKLSLSNLSLWVCLLPLVSVTACSDSGRVYTKPSAGSAGTTDSGGAGGEDSNRGGDASNGGTAGASNKSAVGGKSGLGGSSATGGSSTAAGGTSGFGGSPAGGGTASLGGRESTGGTSASGGTSSSGGASTLGGTSSKSSTSGAVGGTTTISTGACVTATDCSDGDPCNGLEKCNVGVCAAGTPLCVNPDANHCLCVAAAGSCSLQPKDVDKDGYGDALCPGTTGNDCDDTQSSVHPTATEVCDGLDNNCNGKGDIEDGLALSGTDPASPYSSVYLSAGMYQKLYGDWVESMNSYYFVSNLGLQRINRDGTVNGATTTLTPKYAVYGGSSYGVMGASVGETVGLLYTYGSSPSDVAFSTISRGGDNIADAWVVPWSLYVAGDTGNFAGGFVSAILFSGTTPTLRVRPYTANGGVGTQVDEAIAEAGGVQVAGGVNNLGVLVTPNAAAGALNLRLFDKTMVLLRKITVGTGPGVVGIRNSDVAVAYKSGTTVKFQVWDMNGGVLCSKDLGAEIPWVIRGSGNNWHVVFASTNYVKPTVEVISATCKHVDSAQLLTAVSVGNVTRGESQYLTSGKGSALVWRNGFTATSYNIQARFYGDPLCKAATNN